MSVKLLTMMVGQVTRGAKSYECDYGIFYIVVLS